jgi:hypothetical protein
MARASQKNQSDEQKSSEELEKQQEEQRRQAESNTENENSNDEPKQTGGEEPENVGQPEEVDADDLPDPKEEGYDPYQDPSVPSSVIADIVAAELAGGEGSSPTLDECRKAYKEQQDDSE